MPDAHLGETNTSNTCVFCAIIRDEERAYTVFEDDISLAFLDRRPLFPGHCLLVPKVHYETLANLPVDDRVSRASLPIQTCQSRLKEYGKDSKAVHNKPGEVPVGETSPGLFLARVVVFTRVSMSVLWLIASSKDMDNHQ